MLTVFFIQSSTYNSTCHSAFFVLLVRDTYIITMMILFISVLQSQIKKKSIYTQ
jgi:hypothetical protein